MKNRLQCWRACFAVIASGRLFWAVLCLLLAASGLLVSWQYHEFINIQNQNISARSFFAQVLIPLSGGLLLIGLLLVYSSALLFFSRLKSSSWFRLLTTGRWSQSLATGLLSLCLGLGLLPQILVSLLLIPLASDVNIDWWHWGLLLLAEVTVILAFSALVLLLFLKLSSPLLMALSGLLMIVIFYMLSWVPERSLLGGLNWVEPLRAVQLGLLTASSGVLLIWPLLLSIAWIYQWRRTCLLQSPSKFYRGILGLGLLMAIAWPLLSDHSVLSSWRKDMTFDRRFSLNQLQQQQLLSIKQPVEITAVVAGESAKEEITQGYQALAPWLSKSELLFSQQIAEATKGSEAGEFLRIDIGGKQQLLAYPFDRPARQAMLEAIRALSQRKQRFITFLKGHGESIPDGGSGADYKIWADTLRAAGWPVVTLNLNQIGQIPANTELLVIAGSKKRWPPEHLNIIQQYIGARGNLLLLRDPDDSFPRSLSSLLGVDCAAGTLVDWRGYQSGTPHPAIVVARDFSHHPLTANMRGLVALPWSCGLVVESVAGFETIIGSDAGSWNETRIDDKSLMFAKDENEQQKVWPLLVAKHKGQQKIVVVGDSHFVSDSAIRNYDNLQLGLNLASWLTSEPQVQANQLRDAQLKLSFWSYWLIGYFAPLLSAVLGFVLVYVSWHRSQQKQLALLRPLLLTETD